MTEKVAVLGGGNGSFAMASDLSLLGFEVRMWSRFPEEFNEIRSTRTIKVRGPIIQEDAHIACVTEDIGEAVDGVDLICSPIPAFTQESIAECLGPHLEDGQVVFLSPGSFGTVVMATYFREAGYWKDITLAENGTLPYLARKVSPSEVSITTKAIHLPTGVFPAERTEEAIARIRTFFPAVVGIENALSGALMNAGPIIHSPLVVLNTGPIEYLPEFDIHNEGTTPSIRRIISMLDNERIAVREGFGFKPNHYPLEDYYDETRPNEWMYPREAKRQLMESGRWREPVDYQHRYVTEDIAYGLAFLVSVGDYIGVPTPIARSLLTLAGAVTDIDYRKTGRTLESMGLADKSPQELSQFLEGGW